MRFSFLLFLLLFSSFAFAQITVDVHPNFKHSVGGIDTFNRKRMLKIHASTPESEWSNGNHFQNFTNLRDTFLNDLDVYMGRNTGPISYYLNQVGEDPNRPGFADSTDIASFGQNVRNNYANQSSLHPYEVRNELVIGAQQRPFYPDGTPTGQGWTIANGTAAGEYMGRFVNEFFGGNGQPEPAFVEIMNEPLYEFVTVGDKTPAEIFSFHNEAADAIRAQNANVLIGGYTAAFPNFEEDDFQRWHERWKLFIDMSGDKMDFWSIHFYDFNLSWGNQPVLRRGSNMEATLDMLDHYTQLSFNEIKPLVISEYGGRALTLEADPWSPYRDWMSIKSMTSMLLAFSERPQHILSAIPFIIVKAEWGRQDDGDPYPWRLMRQNKELPGQTGNHWVYTEFVKFYQLWSEVKGTRIDSRSTDPDIQTNAFVDGNKLYLILNNLNFHDTTVLLNCVERQNNLLQNIKVKHLYLDSLSNTPMLDENNYSSLDSLMIGAEGSAVIEYTYQNSLLVDELVAETKYYADRYLVPIIPYAENKFEINNIDKEMQGEAVLRLGLGRDHGKSLQPTVKINGFEIAVPDNYMGYDQLTRDSWFGVIEVPIPFYYLQTDNEISVQFKDQGGYISSMAIRVYNHSDAVMRSDSVAPTSLSLVPATQAILPNTSYRLIPTILPITATDPSLIWSSSDPSIATVDSLGVVTGLMLGNAMITASTSNGNLSAMSLIEVVDSLPTIALSSLRILPDSFTLNPAQQLQMQAELAPINASDQTIIWTVEDPNVVSIDSSAMLTANLAGTTHVIATHPSSGLADTSVIHVVTNFNTNTNCNFLPASLAQDTLINVPLSYSTAYASDLVMQLLDSNDSIVGTGTLSVSPGFGTQTIAMICPVVPVVGQVYSLRVMIEALAVDSILFSCRKENVGISFPTNIEDEFLAQIRLFPNPNQGSFKVEIPPLNEAVEMKIFDAMGKMISQKRLVSMSNTIALKDKPAGLYFVRFRVGDKTVVKRMLLQ
ncbi:MAG: Ig-like domain-containing protein [Bacteroidota bacterium]